MLSYCNWLLPLDELDGCPSPHLCKNQSFPKCLKHSVQRDGSSDDLYTIPLFLGLLGVLLLLFCLHLGLAVEWVKVLIKWRISLMWIDVPWFLELVLLKSMLSGLLVKSRCARYQCSENGANEHLHPLRWILYNFTRLNAAQIKGKLQYLSEDVLFSNILIHIAHVHISEIEIKNLLEVCDMYVLNQNAINLRDIVFCKFKHQHFFA